jgi:hypothetical protein
MTSGARLAEYAVFLAVAATVALIVALAGSRFWTGPTFLESWRWGCGVSLAASAVAGLVLAAPLRGRPGQTIALVVMLVRLAALVLLGAGAVVIVGPALRPFLLAVAASYLPLLAVDTAYSLRVARRL